MEKKLIVTKKASRLLAHSPLITREALLKPLTFSEGECVQVLDERGTFLGMAYIGFQNKGVGWIYSRKQGEILQASMIQSLLVQAKQKRQSYFWNEQTTAFRLFNGEGDGLGGVTMDWYDGYMVISWYSWGIYQFQAVWLEQLALVFPEMKGIYEKIRFNTAQRKLPESQFLRGKMASEPHIIVEEGVRYATYLNEGLMTGIFLDQREVRQLLQEEYSAGKTVLNLFSYTGAFSVAAAMGGAKQTTSVDVANRSLIKTQEQFSVNNLPMDQQAIYVMDVFDYLKYARKKQLTFDTIVVDPPSFARTKKRVFSVAQHYAALVAQLIPSVAPQGVLLLSTNAANISDQQFLDMIHTGFQQSKRSYRIAHHKKLPNDFASHRAVPSSNYLKVFIIELDQKE